MLHVLFALNNYLQMAIFTNNYWQYFFCLKNLKNAVLPHLRFFAVSTVFWENGLFLRLSYGFRDISTVKNRRSLFHFYALLIKFLKTIHRMSLV